MTPEFPCVQASGQDLSEQGRGASWVRNAAKIASGRALPGCMRPSALLRSKSNLAVRLMK